MCEEQPDFLEGLRQQSPSWRSKKLTGSLLEKQKSQWGQDHHREAAAHVFII